MATTSSGLTPRRQCGFGLKGDEEILNGIDDFRHPCHAADKNHLIDITGIDASILKRCLAGLDAALDQVVDQFFQRRPGQFDIAGVSARTDPP